MRWSTVGVSLLCLVVFPVDLFAKGAETVIDRIASWNGVVKADGLQTSSARGSGFVLDSSHPRHPGDSTRYELKVSFAFDLYKGDAVLEFESGGEKPETDRYFIRRGTPFQIDEQTKSSREASSLGDLGPSTIAALHPGLVARAIASRRENVQLLGDRAGSKDQPVLLVAWNDALWHVYADPQSGRIDKLWRSVYDDVLGDRVEEIQYSEYRGNMPSRVVVKNTGREIARFDLPGTGPGGEPLRLPAESEHWDERVITNEDITFREIAPNLFTIDLAATNSRVFVAEFTDHVAVIEGAYNSANCDLLAQRIRKHFGKPIRYFSFSHLHGQYVGGTRSYVHEGATVLVPPTTVPLIEQVATAKHDLRPDALSRDPKPVRVEAVRNKLVLEDELNAMAIHNVDSGHTDEYLIFDFPRQKILLSGDLLFYRGAEQPLRGRSRQLCATVTELGLDVERIYVSWPLEGYGVHNTVLNEEFRAACEKPEP